VASDRALIEFWTANVCMVIVGLYLVLWFNLYKG